MYFVATIKDWPKRSNIDDPKYIRSFNSREDALRDFYIRAGDHNGPTWIWEEV